MFVWYFLIDNGMYIVLIWRGENPVAGPLDPMHLSMCQFQAPPPHPHTHSTTHTHTHTPTHHTTPHTLHYTHTHTHTHYTTNTTHTLHYTHIHTQHTHTHTTHTQLHYTHNHTLNVRRLFKANSSIVWKKVPGCAAYVYIEYRLRLCEACLCHR